MAVTENDIRRAESRQREAEDYVLELKQIAAQEHREVAYQENRKANDLED
jgi:hypothetical protein